MYNYISKRLFLVSVRDFDIYLFCFKLRCFGLYPYKCAIKDGTRFKACYLL